MTSSLRAGAESVAASAGPEADGAVASAGPEGDGAAASAGCDADGAVPSAGPEGDGAVASAGPRTGDRAPAGSARTLAAGPLAPLHPAARATLIDALEQGWADPGALHGPGQAARALLDSARETVAGTLGCRVEEVFFDASGPVSAQQVILGVASSRRRIGAGVVVGGVEHAAILQAARWLGDAREVGVDRAGRVDPAEYGEALRSPGVVLGALQLANSEVGTLQPVAEVVAGAAGLPLLVDAGAAIGHVAFRVEELGVEHVIADARAFGGPPGVGIRVLRASARWRRSGPEPADPPAVPLIAATAAALTATAAEAAERAVRDHRLTAWLRAALPLAVPDLAVAGPVDPRGRLPHVLTVSALYVDGEALVQGLDRAGVGAGSGSACTAETVAPSHVLAAMGFLTQGNLRITLGRTATDADVERLLAVLPGVVASIRAESGVAGL